MVNENDKNKQQQTDEDILQGKEDVLRARDIIPDSPQSENQPYLEKKSEHYKESEDLEKSVIDAEDNKAKANIPQFDLAEEIMARHRKITAVKRKGPGQKEKAIVTKSEDKLKHRAIYQSMEKTPEEERLIAEIVARDIQKLCRVG